MQANKSAKRAQGQDGSGRRHSKHKSGSRSRAGSKARRDSQQKGRSSTENGKQTVIDIDNLTQETMRLLVK